MKPLVKVLAELEVIREDRLETYYPRVRDRGDISVLIDPVTEVIVLSSSDHVSEGYYERRKEKSTHTVHGEEVATPKLEDNLRRARDLGGYIRNKRWLDVGCGLGGMLDEMACEASWAAGLELNDERAEIARHKGHHIVESLSELEPGSLDIVTLFHVLEHVPDPVRLLTTLRSLLRAGGRLLLEVPHARDALFTLYDCEGFKRFTFWSEHLVLHTRASLQRVLTEAGFKEAEISGCQRYPLANHLYWMSRGRPGGHDQWRFLSREGLNAEYQASLTAIDRTDTLIAVCRVD